MSKQFRLRQLFSLVVLASAILSCSPRICIAAEQSASDVPRHNGPEPASEDVAVLERFGRIFESVAKRVGPTVVHIKTQKVARVRSQNFTLQETGSGVLVQLPGHDRPYVLTNRHIVAGLELEQLTITSADGRVLHATQAWDDVQSDVAVVAIAERELPAAQLGDSDKLEVGHWVLAIGSPFDLAGSVTLGIVSGKGRRALTLGPERQSVRNQDFIQTDAAINPGNSGGPLVNLRGEVVGINTAIASQSGGSQGVGFAIPINLARRVATELIKQGVVQRAFLGVSLQPLDAASAQKLGLPRVRGAVIRDVYSGTPADQAGLEPLDVIIEVNGKPVEDRAHLIYMISMSPVGEEVSLLVWRNPQKKHLTARLGDWTEFPQIGQELQQSQPFAPLGLRELKELTPQERASLGYAPDQKGVLVVSVVPHSPTALFIERLDVIDQVEDKPVASIAEFADAISALDPEESILVWVSRSAEERTRRLRALLKR